MHPLERLLNLVALLLETPQPLTFEQIRTKLGAYDQGDKASAKRQFERDKDVLRQIGVPLEVASTDAWDVEEGYRILRERYELPDVSFTPDEAAALFVAAHGSQDEAEASRAFRKLLPSAEKGFGLGADEPFAAVDVSGPHLHAVAEAVAGRRVLRFRYRPNEGNPAEREVDAWGLVFRRGAWYLVGRDRDRDDIRAFRLSRVDSGVADAGEGTSPPPEFRAADHLMAGPWGVGEPETTARVAFAPKVAWWAVPEASGAHVLRTGRDGWVEAEVPATASEAFVSWVLSFGEDAEVLEPPELREAVVAALRRVHASV